MVFLCQFAVAVCCCHPVFIQCDCRLAQFLLSDSKQLFSGSSKNNNDNTSPLIHKTRPHVVSKAAAAAVQTSCIPPTGIASGQHIKDSSLI